MSTDNTYRPTFEPSPWPQSWSCNCACSVCMAGQCCMDPNRFASPTVVGTGTGYFHVTAPHEHSWLGVGLLRGFVVQSCPCGEVRRVPVP